VVETSVKGSHGVALSAARQAELLIFNQSYFIFGPPLVSFDASNGAFT
jgi:hypothetical protein